MLNTKKSSPKKNKRCHGTQEWAVETINCCTGCSHGCLYCYAKSMGIKFGWAIEKKWLLEQVRQKDVDKIYKKYHGQVMFPSSHDITPNNFEACMTVLRCLIVVGNRMLVVSKPHLDCIKKLCEWFRPYRRRMLLRFTIGARDDGILSFWEPNAPCYAERKQCLVHAYKAGFKTSVSVEPMLDAADIDTLIDDLSPYVTDSIWIGKMNNCLKRLEKDADAVMKQAIERIRHGQMNANIKEIYQRHKDNPLIKWKKEFKKVVGISIPEQNGLDI